MLVTKTCTVLSTAILQNYVKTGIAFSSPEIVRNVYKFPRTFRGNKHWNPKYKKLRGLKVIKVDLPKYNENTDFDELTPELKRAWYKERGLQPVRPWHEKPFVIHSLPGVIDEYLPPEGDGKLSALNTAGAQQKLEWLKKKTGSWKDLRKIRKYEDDFELYPEFVDQAQEIYLKAHECLAANDEENLIKYVTEKAYPLMLFNSKCKTIRWKFIKSIEPPRVCHIRANEIVNKTNVFGQITIRFHTQQVLAIYDRFGRLMHGSESVAKDVLEYVVFEKHISNQHGAWRLHHKILPDWLPELQPSPRTYIQPEEEKESGLAKDAVGEKLQTIFKVPT